ncbi:ECF transporter S component [Vagococcus elongatus]|uniref:ECF transporter S component n=1 Tax=Vagococcus elongatus TaxID=180344 RepID=A0A430B5R8_9ENTE|nr:ECF transporter S component [Vagococcus elongatus]RSU15649.1 ECF transporter S component [Vagococcus elongatus]
MLNSNKPKKPIYSIKEIAYLGLLIAACVVGRTAFQAIPNVQPATAIFLIITLYLGITRGLIVCLATMTITNLYMGMGSWMIGQMISYTFIIILFGILGKISYFKKSLVLQSIVSFFSGFIYGFIFSIVDVQIYGMKSFLAYYLQGVPFDFLHAVGNIGFYIILVPILRTLLKKYQETLS